jgi:hypothetical protein
MKAPVKRFGYLAMHVQNALTRRKGAGTSPSPLLEPVCGLLQLPPCAVLTMIFKLWVTSTALVDSDPSSPPGGVLQHAYACVREEYGLD